MNDFLSGETAETAETAKESRNAADRSSASDGERDAELLGVADIVEAFTALRHELKSQVRNGRELHETLSAGLQRIERSVAAHKVPGSGTTTLSGDTRLLAEAIAEMEENLQRAREALARRSTPDGGQTGRLSQFEAAVGGASWLARRFSRQLVTELKRIVEQSIGEMLDASASLETACQGLELLHERARRLMQQCGIERMDVLHKPFDAETMHALDVVDSDCVPSAHVVEQLRPAYRWQGIILRFANVRIAR